MGPFPLKIGPLSSADQQPPGEGPSATFPCPIFSHVHVLIISAKILIPCPMAVDASLDLVASGAFSTLNCSQE